MPTVPKPTIRPVIAIPIGIPIATTLPNVKVRMTIAARMPINSGISLSELDRVEPMDPPASTSIPTFCAGAVASTTAWAISVVSSPLSTSSSTEENAVRPSALIKPADGFAVGSDAL